MSGKIQGACYPIHGITLDRVKKFYSSDALRKHFSISSYSYTPDEPTIKVGYYSVPRSDKRPTCDLAKGFDFRPLTKDMMFGPSGTTHWFKIEISLPNSDEWQGQEVLFGWDSGCEALIWKDDQPYQGLTDARNEALLTKHSRKNERFQLYIEMVCSNMAGNFSVVNDALILPDENKFFKIKRMDISIPNKIARELHYRYGILVDMVTCSLLNKNTLLSSKALFVANQMMNQLHEEDPDSWNNCLSMLNSFFEKSTNKCPSDSLKMFAIGHCHIDTAWLWTFDESKRKCLRSWSSQLALMERYPDFIFGASQAAQYDWVLQESDKLFWRIKEAVQKGQWELLGGTWVEMDTNLPSGESLIRQFVHGQNFFKEYFGKYCDIFWLPDTFGYSPQLPQIMKSAHCKRFMSQKLSWNNINHFPRTTFYWEGLNGDKVLTHFPPSATYNANVKTEEFVKSEINHEDKDRSPAALLVYGQGDGGGGPTVGMLESIEVLKDSTKIPGISHLQYSTVSNFFDYIENIETKSKSLLTWKGELYFEFHRGTYTTQSGIKMRNRLAESLLRQVELIYSMISVYSNTWKPYPAKGLDQAWKDVLLNQFHDVLPGSCIRKVVLDAETMLDKVIHDCQQWLDQSWDLIDVGSAQKNQCFIWNQFQWDLNGITHLPSSLHNAEEVKCLIAKDLSPFSLHPVSTAHDSDYPAIKISKNKDTIIVENNYIKVYFNANGQITQLQDKNCMRSLIPDGQVGNCFVYYEDIPLFWDAWDVEYYHLQKGWHASMEDAKMVVLENGPLRAVLLLEAKLSSTSTLSQKIYLTADSSRIEFDTNIDWNESHKCLKVCFPLNLSNYFASFETQHGWIARPTTRNNSWEMAKFEVVGHRFADVSEFDYGVSLINNGKVGYGVEGNVIQLTLLRSSKMPDELADIGHNSFKYTLFPHQGSHMNASVIKEAAALNSPPVYRHHTNINNTSSIVMATDLKVPFFRLEAPPIHNNKRAIDSNQISLIIDVIKRSEMMRRDQNTSDGNNLKDHSLIVRAYESKGGRGRALLKWSFDRVKSVSLVDVLELPLEEIDAFNLDVVISDKMLCFDYLPFQIITLKFDFV